MLVDCMIAVVRPANQWHVISDACTCKMCLHTREENKRPYSELLKLNDFNEMSVPAARTQLLKLTNVASSLCLAS